MNCLLAEDSGELSSLIFSENQERNCNICCLLSCLWPETTLLDGEIIIPKGHGSMQTPKNCSLNIRKFYECKIELIFLPINLNMCFGCSKERSH